MTRSIPFLLALWIAPSALLGCAKPDASDPHRTASPGVPAGYGPDGATIPPPSDRIATPAQVDPACTTSHYEGTVGDCLEPALVIEDHCGGRRYEIRFNACYESKTLDTKGLVNGYRKITGITREDLTRNAKHVEPAKAIRGSIGGADRTGAILPFDVEIDFDEGGATRTTRLRGTSGGWGDPAPPR